MMNKWDGTPPDYFAGFDTNAANSNDDEPSLQSSEASHGSKLKSKTMSNEDHFMVDEDQSVMSTLSAYWTHAELKQTLGLILKNYGDQNIEFFQLRNNFIKLSQLPIYYKKNDKSCIAYKSTLYVMPLIENPYVLRNDLERLKEIYCWGVGNKIAVELMPELTEEKKVEATDTMDYIGDGNNSDMVGNVYELDFECLIHFDRVSDESAATKMYISETMTAGKLIQKLKDSKYDLRYQTLQIYIYDEELQMIDGLSLVKCCVV